MESQVALCGRKVCSRFCVRAIHCPLGQARASQLLSEYRQRRKLRRLVVGRVLEANIRRAAGSFGAFQLQLLWESPERGEVNDRTNSVPNYAR